MAHNARSLAEDISKHMDDLHDWGDKVDQLAVSFSVFLKLLRLVSEQQKDIIGGMATFELSKEVVFSEVDFRLFGVFLQSAIEDILEPRCR
jgi:hypothetical protein